MPNFPSYVSQAYNLNESVGEIKVKRAEVIPETGENGIFFYNDYSLGQPLYREPNNGAVRRIKTSLYAFKDCQYVSNGDTNGLAYWAGTKFGNTSWENPAGSFFYVYPSNRLYDENYNTIDGNFDQLFDRTSSLITTSDDPLSNIQVYFAYLGDEQFYINGLYIKSPNASTYGFLQNYTIQITDRNSGGITYEKQIINNELVGIDNEIYIPIDNLTQPCDNFFIRQGGLNSIGTNHLCLGEIEFYGVFK